MIIYWTLCFLIKIFYFLVFGYRSYNKKNVPKEGSFLICANHKSNWDPPAIAISLPRRLGFLAKAELFKNALFGSFLKYIGAFPIKRGSGDIGAMKTALSVIKSGKPLLIFPEGTRTKGRGIKKANNGAIRLAIMTGVPILPVGIGGEYKPFGKLKVNIGECISYEKYKGMKLTEEELNELTKELMEKIYDLSDN